MWLLQARGYQIVGIISEVREGFDHVGPNLITRHKIVHSCKAFAGPHLDTFRIQSSSLASGMYHFQFYVCLCRESRISCHSRAAFD